MKAIKYTVVLLTVLACSASTFAAAAADSPAKPPRVTLQQMKQDLQSKDPARVASAVNTIRDVILVRRSDFDLFLGMDLLLKYKQYDVVEQACLQSMLDRPENAGWIAKCQRARVLALLGMGKNDDALAAAKSYYNVALLSQTNDAIHLLARCLEKAKPDGRKLAERFKRQQAAWADVKYVPGAPKTSAAGSDDQDLGEPILPTIKADPKPFADLLNVMELDSYDSYMGSGNLLLMSDQPDDAKTDFEQAMTATHDPAQATAAVERIACAIRAQSGCIGPANAYILSLRTKAVVKK